MSVSDVSNFMIIINGKFFCQPFSGVQRFSKEIALRLINDDNFLIVAPSCFNEKVVIDKNKLIKFGNFKGILWEQLELPFFLYREKKKFILNLGNTAPLTYKYNIVTNHGLAWKFFPDSYSMQFILWYKFLIPKILLNSRLIITVSNTAKAELIETFKIPEDKIEVVYPGVSECFLNSKRYQNNLHKKYILYVGTFQHYKNVKTLIEAFYLLNETHYEFREFELLLCGHMPNVFKRKPYLRSSKRLNEKINQKIKIIGPKYDEELVILYKQAFCLVVPSLYESFGLPILEAFACECPVIASKLPAIYEYAKDAVLYFDPKDPMDLASKFIDLYKNPVLRYNLIKKGRQIAHEFTWNKTIAKLKEILKSKFHLD